MSELHGRRPAEGSNGAAETAVTRRETGRGGRSTGSPGQAGVAKFWVQYWVPEEDFAKPTPISV
ncbi:hypothetical protein Q0Z83_042880 [Actinoplanes sichuanensis]|nr:hypothetical protein Q0Z83_042880 [Actinoplanes sichuanensis]